MEPVTMGYLAMAAATAASSAMAYRGNMQANQANQLINSHNAEQAWDMYHGTMKYNQQEADTTRAYNTAEAVAARQYNTQEAEAARAFSATEAQKSRDFSAWESSTSYQRAVADLKAAGLNPMLAYSQGGASTPSSAMASAPAASGPSASASPASISGGQIGQRIAMRSAMEGVQTNLLQSAGSIAESFARAKNTEAQTQKTIAETPGAQATSTQLVEDAKFAQERTEERMRILHHEETKLRMDYTARREAFELEREALKAKHLHEIKELDTQKYAQVLQKINIQLDELKVPEAKARSDYWKGIGKYEPYVDLAGKATNIAGDLINSATGIGRFKELLKEGAWNRSERSDTTTSNTTKYDKEGNPAGGSSTSTTRRRR